MPAADKVGWLRELDDAARAVSPEVVQVVGVYGDSLQRRLIATSDGRWVEEDRPRIRIVSQVVAKRGDNIQTGFHGPAACAGVEFIDAHTPRATAEVAAERAVTMLDSVPAPAGEMTVVLAPGMGGVLFHEAVGHPLEADAIDKEASVYRGLVGTKCASELINGVDDATIANGWGSFTFDDEGTPAQRTVLFTDGVLQGFLYDRLRAEKDGVESTGNGRRQSYASPPVVRMTNTNILNGASTPEQVLADTPSGVYVTALGGGQVNPATGDFVFGVSEGYMIEHGEVDDPGARREPDRARDRGHERRRRGRRRLRHVGRRLRQGRPERTRRQRLADAAHLEDHGGRHRCLTSASWCAPRSTPPRPTRRSRRTPRSRGRPRRARSAARSRGSSSRSRAAWGFG